MNRDLLTRECDGVGGGGGDYNTALLNPSRVGVAATTEQ